MEDDNEFFKQEIVIVNWLLLANGEPGLLRKVPF